MSRVLYLGAGGEMAWSDLLTGYELISGFQLCFVATPHAKSLAEIRRRLEGCAPAIFRLEVQGDLVKQTVAIIPQLKKQQGRSVIWLEQARYDHQAWRDALRSLNQHRDWYRREAPGFLVLAGPPELLELVQQVAQELWSIRSIVRELSERPRLAPAAATVRWLHLSDLQLGTKEQWQDRPLLTSLLQEVVEPLDAQGLAPDMVMLSGDIARSGQPAEYEQAESFCNELGQRLGLEPRQRWFLVPGNHDVDRSAIELADRLILNGLTDQAAISRVLTDAAAMRVIGRRCAPFAAFTGRLLGAARSWQADHPWRVDALDINGIPVAVIQLSSAWAIGSDAEKARVLVGKAQVHQALELAADAFLKVALVHHPPEALRNFDREPVEELLDSPRGVSLLVHGHLHHSRLVRRGSAEDADAKTEIAAGSLYPAILGHGRYPRVCSLVEVDLGAGQTRVHVYQHSSGGRRGQWQRQSIDDDEAARGIYTIPLPPHLHLDEQVGVPAKTPAAGTLSEAKRRSLISRFREAVAASLTPPAVLIGPAGGHTQLLRLDELTVPLRLRLHALEPDPGARSNIAESAIRSTADLARSLLGSAASTGTGTETGNGKAKGNGNGSGEVDTGAVRLMVLGEAGSGKTTLCRFLAAVLAGSSELDGVVVHGEPVPLLLDMREYLAGIAASPELSLLDHLAERAANRLAVRLPDDLLEDMSSNGEVVLLVDGLDEVPSADQQVVAREAVLAFCRSFPGAPVLLTSRRSCLEQEAQPSGETVFSCLQLLPFSDDELGSFVTRWYTGVLTESPQARQRGIADLSATLEADPALRELARNPLLATLLALVHRSAACLHGNRARLYEQVVRTLLVTWPALHGCRFAEIDEDLQRAALEQLAFSLLERWEQESEDLVLPRERLVCRLVEILRRRSRPPETAEHTGKLVEAWVDHLTSSSRLLVTQRADALSFLHRSLLEYLAGRGLERHAGSAIAAEIADRYDRPAWQPVCRLLVAAHAEDEPFLDSLFAAITRRARDSRWLFLLQCLADEVLLLPRHREEILRGATRYLLEQQQAHERAEIESVLAWVTAHSHRHGEAVRDWYQRQLLVAGGEDLQAVVALQRQTTEDEVVAALQQRQDTAEAARWMLDLWPGSEVGCWAAGKAEPRACLEWALQETPHDLLVLRGIAALVGDLSHRTGPSPGLTAALATALSRRTIMSGFEAARGFATLVEEQPGTRVPQALTVAEVVLSCQPSLPLMPKAVDTDPLPIAARHVAHSLAGRYLAQLSDRPLTDLLSWELTGAAACGIGTRFLPQVNTAMVNDLLRGFPRSRADTLVRELAAELAQPYTGDGILNGSSVESFAGDVVADWCRAVIETTSIIESDPGPPDGKTQKGAGPSWQQLAATTGAGQLLRVLAGEYLLGLAITERLGRHSRLVHLLVRDHNRWLLTLWPVLDSHLGEAPTPAALALYLALGWTQQSTTLRWPDSKHWRTLLAGKPPKHWLPRLHWYLCWLVDEQESEEHLAGMDEALASGLDDDEFPGIAEALQPILSNR